MKYKNTFIFSIPQITHQKKIQLYHNKAPFSQYHQQMIHASPFITQKAKRNTHTLREKGHALQQFVVCSIPLVLWNVRCMCCNSARRWGCRCVLLHWQHPSIVLLSVGGWWCCGCVSPGCIAFYCCWYISLRCSSYRCRRLRGSPPAEHDASEGVAELRQFINEIPSLLTYNLFRSHLDG